MLDSLVIGLREGLEASLIIGIILVYLVKTNRTDLKKSVFQGLGAGILTSVILGVVLFVFASEASEELAEVFEVGMMIAAAALITYFLFWLHKNKNVTQEVHQQIDRNSSKTGLFMLAFFAVVREGMELVVFNITQVSEGALTITFASLIGIILAIGIAVLLFKTSINLNLKLLFAALGVVLIYIGGHLLAEGVVELGEMTGWIVNHEMEEIIEISALLLYIIPALLLMYFSDLKNLTKRTTA